MLRLKAVDDVVHFRVRDSSFDNTAALWNGVVVWHFMNSSVFENFSSFL